MAGEFEQPLGKGTQPGELGVGGIEPGFDQPAVGHVVAPVAPDRAGELGGDVLGQPERLADLADRAAWAVVDHGGGDSGSVPAVALVDVLDHLLAPLVLEIDVYVGRLVAVLRQEAREQQLLLDRIDRGHAEQVAHQRIGRAAASWHRIGLGRLRA